MEHVFFSPASYLPNYLDEPRFIVDDLNFLSLVKVLWSVVCGGNKIIDLLSRSSTFSLECFLKDNKDRNKQVIKWTKAAETLPSEIAQVTVAFSGLQPTQNSSMREHHERYIGIFSNSEKSFSLLHAQLNGKCLLFLVIWQGIYDPGQTQQKDGDREFILSHLNLLCCPDQILAVMELSQHLVLSSKTIRPIIL